jgi:hypothetical protein
METKGREHRHHFYTLRSAREVNERGNLGQENQGWYTANLSHIGEFAEVSADVFYSDESSLHYFQDEFKNVNKMSSGNKKRKREGPDGHVDDNAQSGSSVAPSKRKRGRPPKKKSDIAADANTSAMRQSNSVQAPKRRGRPPKKKPEAVSDPVPTQSPLAEKEGHLLNQNTNDPQLPTTSSSNVPVTEGGNHHSAPYAPNRISEYTFFGADCHSHTLSDDGYLPITLEEKANSSTSTSDKSHVDQSTPIFSDPHHVICSAQDSAVNHGNTEVDTHVNDLIIPPQPPTTHLTLPQRNEDTHIERSSRSHLSDDVHSDLVSVTPTSVSI